jgi:Putative transposase
VPFSCKRNTACSSCAARRMTALAAHLVDEVLPLVPVRKWVLTMPYRLRYMLAWDHKLCRAVLGVYIRALLGSPRRQARKSGVLDGRGGAVTVIQRFGSALNVNVHFHALLLDGVFTADEDGTLHFHSAVPPTDKEVARLLVTIRIRIIRLLRRRGLIGEDADPTAVDSLETASSALAGIIGASIRGRTALGRRPGRRVLRLGSDPDASWVTSTAARQAHLDGFDLHANVAVGAQDREGVEKLCRSLLRPPLAQRRLQLTDDGRVLMELHRPWSDGTTHLLFEGVELLEKLAAITPRPRINLLLYYGLLAPRARWRSLVTSYGGPQQAASTGDVPVTQPAICAPTLVSQHSEQPGSPEQSHGNENETMNAPGSVASSSTSESSVHGRSGSLPDGASAKEKKRYSAWSDLMRQTFSLDVLACPRCHQRMRLIATIEDPAVVKKILNHLGLGTEVPESQPARPPPV